MPRTLKIHPADTVAVALEPLSRGTPLDAHGLTLADDVPQGHKFALQPIVAGQPVIKYGVVIGAATSVVATGAHVHTHNLRTALSGIGDYTYAGKMPDAAPTPANPPTIRAYVRVDGQVGIRNDLWIIPLVGCINGLAQTIGRHVTQSGLLPPESRVAVPAHPYGCSQLGDDLANTRGILRNLALHPNAGGVLVLGLGCENNTRSAFAEGLLPADPRRIRYVVSQEAEDEIADGVAACRDLAAIMAADVRAEVGADRLRVGLRCGGSDGLSGITANLLLGAFSDWLCSAGGATVLTEVPEMFGAEPLLMARAEDRAVFERVVALVNDFKRYYIANGQPIYENPSPGNKDGGITTLEEKSLGCTQKAGLSPVRGVLSYTDRLQRNGLNLLSAPGNDAVAVTALAASGCHLVLFTTGRGTPLGSVVPTVKVATNSTLARRKPHGIDFDAGPIAEGVAGLGDLNEAFIRTVLEIAEGKPTRNETNDMREIAIFKTGVTL